MLNEGICAVKKAKLGMWRLKLQYQLKVLVVCAKK